MVKGNPKSSASSGTRKKHAKKQQRDAPDEMASPPSKGGKASKKTKEPKVKMYILPIKPAPVQPDPLETTGLGRTLPPELVVLLKSLAKKASLTKTRALEDLQFNWIDQCKEGEEKDVKIWALMEMVPVWLHHIPALYLSPSRRVRFLASNANAALLAISEVGQRIIDFLSQTASETQVENVLGTWLLAANDVDKQVSGVAKKSWDEFVDTRRVSIEKLDPAQSSEGQVTVNAATLSSINSFTQRAALDPIGIYLYFNPIAPSVPLSIVHPSQNRKGSSTPSTQNKGKGSIAGKGTGKGASTLQSSAATPRSIGGDETPKSSGSSKGDEQEESEADRRARLRIGALGGLKWLLGIATSSQRSSESSEDIYANPALWTSLNRLPRSPWLEDSDIESFGYAQPGVRKAAWGLVMAVLNSAKESLPADIQSALGIAILRSAWIETDTLVQGMMWQPLLVFVQKYPQSWLQEANAATVNPEDTAEGRDDQTVEGVEVPEAAPSEQIYQPSGGPFPPQAYLEYLEFLSAGCQGSPIQGLPTVVLVLSTIPNSILFTSPPTTIPLDLEPLPSESPPEPLTAFFDALWLALSSRSLSSLNRSKTHAALLSALLECLIFLTRKIRRTRHDVSTSNTFTKPSLDNDLEQRFVTKQLRKVWIELGSSKLKVEPHIAATQIASSIQTLYGVNEQLGGSAWGVITEQLKETASSHLSAEGSKLVSTGLKVFADMFSKEGQVLSLKDDVNKLQKEVLRAEIERIHNALVASDRSDQANGEPVIVPLDLLVDLTDNATVWASWESTSILDALLYKHAYTLLKASNLGLQLLLSYLSRRNDHTKCLSVWHSLLNGIAPSSPSSASSSAPSLATIDVKTMKTLLSVVKRSQIPTYLRPKADELDDLVGAQLQEVLTNPMTQGRAEDLAIVEGVLGAADYFISSNAYGSFLGVITATSSSCVFKLLEESAEPETIATLDMATVMIQATFESLLLKSDVYGELLLKLVPSIFIHAYLVPSCVRSEEVDDAPLKSRTVPVAEKLWGEWAKSQTVNPKLKADVMKDLKDNFNAFVRGTQYLLSPRDIIQLVAHSPLGTHVDLLKDVFPSSTELGAHLDSLCSELIDPNAVVLDDALPAKRPRSRTQLRPTTLVESDHKGFHAYARVVDGILQLFLEDRPLAKQNLWVLRHLVALSLYAEDLLDSGINTASWSPVFDTGVVRNDGLIELKGNIKKLSVYLVNSMADHGPLWRRGVVDHFLSQEGPSDLFSPPQNLLWGLIDLSRRSDSVRDARILKLVLESILASGYEDRLDPNEGDQWVMLARKVEKTAPQTSISILAVLSSSGAEPPKLDRYRNELAASLLGIKPHSMSSEALIALRKLAASAPPANSDVVFLPTPRAVNVVKSLQSWVLAEGDDEDDNMDEEIESIMLSIFVHLAPILQGVVGSHWPFVFDVLEGVLDRVCSEDAESKDYDGDEEDSNLVALARGLRLVVVLEDLSKRNKTLMDEWKDRRTNVLTLIRDSTVLLMDHSESLSAPLSTVRHLILTILRNIPSDLIDEGTLPKMVHLLRDSSTRVQKTAYVILQKAAKTRTEHFVIEAGVDTEDVVKPILPPQLVEIVMRDVWLGDDGAFGEHGSSDVFGYLLGWMLIFDSFADASFKVRSGYIQQLRDMKVVVDHFIPFLLRMLQLEQAVLSKAFKLGIWGVDAFYVNLYEPGRPHSLPVLAAHIYYRSLLTIPSLINSWILDCKDRQLTSGVTAYTSMYFSPVLVKAELEHVRTHAVDDKLADESLSVKVTSTNPGGTGAAAIASKTNEVIAAYSVDEHQLEIRIRIPSDWPLHRAEVKDVKRVGVDENKWRAWVLGVQQTMWAHNGRIIDGLELFKKNVTLHFEGQVECAICYSIISVMDGSLPKKPCKTCKNRFHASCLYKWFNTSHSSSCPLCRSDII